MYHTFDDSLFFTFQKAPKKVLTIHRVICKVVDGWKTDLDYPIDEEDDEGKNLNEEALIETQIARYRRKDSFSYSKVLTSAAAEKYLDGIKNLSRNDINVLVINFVDIASGCIL